MRDIRLFTPQKLNTGCITELNMKASHHANQVLRLKNEHRLTLFNGDGYNYKARIISRGKLVQVEILDQISNQRESPLEINLIQSISRNDRMEFTLQKATELGVLTIQPVYSERSSKKLTERQQEKKSQRWCTILESASEQSGRSVVPGLLPIHSLEEILNKHQKITSTSFVLSPASKIKLGDIKLNNNRCSVLIGPEGGLTKQEIELAESKGFVGVSLGPRILRTETAGLAVISILQSRHGDL